MTAGARELSPVSTTTVVQFHVSALDKRPLP